MQYKLSHFVSIHSKQLLSHSSTLSWQAAMQKMKLDQLWRVLVHALVSRAELEVDWKRDRHNSLYLEVYDPETKKRHRFTSEQDALVWLEKRHY